MIKYGSKCLKDGNRLQTYLCKSCNKRSNERTGSPMARLRTRSGVVSLAVKMRTEGMGIRAAGRVLEKSHATIIRWEKRLPPSKRTGLLLHLQTEISQLKEMKCILAWARTFPPSESSGWTINFLERQSRYWLVAQAGKKDKSLFEQASHKAWQ